jgi:hypothetical protein
VLNRIRPRIVLVIALTGVWWLLATVPAGAQSPLEQQRLKPRAPVAVTPALSGRVVSVHNGLIYTSIIVDWPSAGISGGTALRVRLGGRTLDARFLNPARYLQVVTDPAARKGLDVDVACTVDTNGALVVVGLAGGLSEWLGLKFGSPVTVEKR